MALQERDFFTDKPETRPASYACPRCGRRNDYQVRWVRRIKKDRIPSGADERDRAMYGKHPDGPAKGGLRRVIRNSEYAI